MSSSTSSSEVHVQAAPARRLLWRVAALAIFVVACMVAAFMGLPSSESKFLAALIDKDQALRQAESPKMVLAGGSNLAFGLDSPLLEERLPYDVVNMGLHSGFGTQYMLSHLEPHLKSGDVVVLALEYHLLHGKGSDQGLAEALAEFPGGLAYLSRRDDLSVGQLLVALQKRVQRALGLLDESADPVYVRSGFNPNGDLLTHLGQPQGEFGHTYESFEKPPSASTAELLNDFQVVMRSRSVRVVLTFPPFPAEYAAPGRQAWLDELDRLLDLPIISRPETFLLPRSVFYDTCYHLGASGRQQRTERLADDLVRAGFGP